MHSPSSSSCSASARSASARSEHSSFLNLATIPDQQARARAQAATGHPSPLSQPNAATGATTAWKERRDTTVKGLMRKLSMVEIPKRSRPRTPKQTSISISTPPPLPKVKSSASSKRKTVPAVTRPASPMPSNMNKRKHMRSISALSITLPSLNPSCISRSFSLTRKDPHSPKRRRTGKSDLPFHLPPLPFSSKAPGGQDGEGMKVRFEAMEFLTLDQEPWVGISTDEFIRYSLMGLGLDLGVDRTVPEEEEVDLDEGIDIAPPRSLWAQPEHRKSASLYSRESYEEDHEQELERPQTPAASFGTSIPSSPSYSTSHSLTHSPPHSQRANEVSSPSPWTSSEALPLPRPPYIKRTASSSSSCCGAEEYFTLKYLPPFRESLEDLSSTCGDAPPRPTRRRPVTPTPSSTPMSSRPGTPNSLSRRHTHSQRERVSPRPLLTRRLSSKGLGLGLGTGTGIGTLDGAMKSNSNLTWGLDSPTTTHTHFNASDESLPRSMSVSVKGSAGHSPVEPLGPAITLRRVGSLRTTQVTAMPMKKGQSLRGREVKWGYI